MKGVCGQAPIKEVKGAPEEREVGGSTFFVFTLSVMQTLTDEGVDRQVGGEREVQRSRGGLVLKVPCKEKMKK